MSNADGSNDPRPNRVPPCTLYPNGITMEGASRVPEAAPPGTASRVTNSAVKDIERRIDAYKRLMRALQASTLWHEEESTMVETTLDYEARAARERQGVGARVDEMASEERR